MKKFFARSISDLATVIFGEDDPTNPKETTKSDLINILIFVLVVICSLSLLAITS